MCSFILMPTPTAKKIPLSHSDNAILSVDANNNGVQDASEARKVKARNGKLPIRVHFGKTHHPPIAFHLPEKALPQVTGHQPPRSLQTAAIADRPKAAALNCP